MYNIVLGGVVEVLGSNVAWIQMFAASIDTGGLLVYNVCSKVAVLLLLIIVNGCSHFVCVFCVFGPYFVINQLSVLSTVLPAKSESDAMFCLQSY